MKKAQLFYGGVSVWIVFQCFMVFLAPNNQTYLGGKVAALALPYTSFLEFAPHWSFFAPDPGPPPLFFEYDLLKDGVVLASKTYPEKNHPYFFQDRQIRRIAIARFLAQSDAKENTRVETTLARKLCVENTNADSIKIWVVTYAIPNLFEVAEHKKVINDTSEADKKWVGQYLCEAYRKNG